MAHSFVGIEQKAGEPVRTGKRGVQLWLWVGVRWLGILLMGSLFSPLWLPYLLLVSVFGRPPNVPRTAQILRYLRGIWTENPPPPGLSTAQRAWLTASVLRKVVTIPVWGCAWLLDELIEGRRLEATKLVAPLFEISAGRSGSTQLARYLEDDPSLSAPSLLQSIFPFLWLWRIAPVTVGRFWGKEKVRHAFEQMLPPEFKERHEGDPFRTDTFEACLYMDHLNHLSFFLGPEMGAAEFSTSRLTPENRALWEEDFVRMVERIGQKHLLWSGGKRLFVKGHFLCAGPALARKFPDARFLTMVRSPEKRFQSAINYLRANPLDEVLGPVPWNWLTEVTLRSESNYCKAEMAWFTVESGRCVVRFEDYVRDLPGTMEKIYAACMDGPVPAHVPREHPPRRRERYLLDRSLEELGVDVALLRTELAEYEAWCKGR